MQYVYIHQKLESPDITPSFDMMSFQKYIID